MKAKIFFNLEVKKIFACAASFFVSYFHIFLYLKNLAPPGLNPVSAPDGFHTECALTDVLMFNDTLLMLVMRFLTYEQVFKTTSWYLTRDILMKKL